MPTSTTLAYLTAYADSAVGSLEGKLPTCTPLECCEVFRTSMARTEDSAGPPRAAEFDPGIAADPPRSNERLLPLIGAGRARSIRGTDACDDDRGVARLTSLRAVRRLARSARDQPDSGDFLTKRAFSASGFAWLRPYVLAFDQWLCRCQHVYEFTDDPQCLFRIQCVRSNETFKLADGTYVRPGWRVIALHFWNEHVPLMGCEGPSLAWARRLDRAVEASLCGLAGYLAEHPGLSDIAAICGDMRLSGEEQCAQFVRIAARYGFESIGRQVERRGVLHRIGDTILILMLMSATNARALRSAPLRLTNARVWLSRAMLDRYRPTH